MPSIVFVHPDGSRTEIEGREGASVMQTAVDGGIDEILGECGGNMMCATCHVYVDDAWIDRVGRAGADGEGDMLDETASPRGATSRLSCQLKVAAELDGLVVRLPDAQV
jgi:2Fe-2S ferredoxin